MRGTIKKGRWQGNSIFCIACEVLVAANWRKLRSLLSSNHAVSGNAMQKVKIKKERINEKQRAMIARKMRNDA